MSTATAITLNASEHANLPAMILTAFWTGLVVTLQALVATAFVLIITKKYRSPSSKCSGFEKSSKKPQLPPGPVGWPLIGNIPEMVKSRPVFRWIHSMMKEMNTEIACIRLGNTHVIPVTCPKIAREMFKQQDTVFASRPLSFSQNILSGGYKTCVITPFGDQFKKMRRILMTEIVCPARHRWLHDKRVEEADHMTAWVYNICKASKPVNLREIGRHYCGNLIRKLMFSTRYFGKAMPDGGPGAADVEHVDAMFEGLGYTFAFAVADFIPILTGLDLDGHEKIMRWANGVMDKYHDPIVDQRIKEWREDKTRDKVEDFLDVFISLKDSEGNPLLSPEEIKPEIKELVMAAVDNPSNAVEWAIAEMLNQPEILQKALEELDRIVGRDRQVQESDISKLNYVKACLREAFRLHPVAAFNLPHVALSDTTVAGYHIPKGSQVLLSRYGLGRNPKVWVDPLRFKPERHLKECSEVTLTENDLRFISFSTGRRGCAAPALGTAITVMLFARLLHGYTWHLPPGTDRIELVESSGDLFMAKPLVLTAEPRLPPHVYPHLTMN